MPDKYCNHNDKYHRIEEQDGKDGTEEGPEEYPDVSNETAGIERTSKVTYSD